MWETIPSGPVAQFSPREKRGYGSRAARAAATSVPTSIVPVFSIVSDTMTGTSRFIASRVSKQETTAILTCSRSWHVSMISRSTPASTRARACSAKASASGSTADVPERGELRRRAHGARDERVGAGLPDRSLRVLHRRAVDLRDAVAEPVLRQDDPVGAEGVRLQHHRPRVEERLVPFPDHLGRGNVQEFVAPLAPLPGGRGDLHPLQVRPAGPVEQQKLPVSRRHRFIIHKCVILE